MSQIN